MVSLQYWLVGSGSEPGVSITCLKSELRRYQGATKSVATKWWSNVGIWLVRGYWLYSDFFPAKLFEKGWSISHDQINVASLMLSTTVSQYQPGFVIAIIKHYQPFWPPKRYKMIARHTLHWILVTGVHLGNMHRSQCPRSDLSMVDMSPGSQKWMLQITSHLTWLHLVQATRRISNNHGLLNNGWRVLIITS